jgi:hypothetical protein
MKILSKINSFAIHPIGMFINVILTLELLSRTSLNHPFAIFVIWFAIHGITGWRIMGTCSNLYFTYNEWKRHTTRIHKLLIVSLIILVVVIFFDITNFLIWSASFTGISLAYSLRNQEYKKRYGCLWIK